MPCLAAPRVPPRRRIILGVLPRPAARRQGMQRQPNQSLACVAAVACCARPGHCVYAVPPVLSHHRCRSLGHRRPPVASGGRDESRNRTERGPVVIKCGRGYARVSMTRHGGPARSPIAACVIRRTVQYCTCVCHPCPCVLCPAAPASSCARH